jgi:hypothetical protein
VNPTAAAPPFAVVILAGRATAADREHVAAMVAAARELGSAATVVAVPRGWRAPPQSRVAHVGPGASAINAIRTGMAQLSNSPARYALLWPLAAAYRGDARLRALVDETLRERPALAALEGDDLESSPLMIVRDAWLDLMTLGEQGMSAVAARHAVRRVAADAT